MSTCVCVLSNNGERLMPTFRLGKVRRLLKDGKAKIVKHHPFTIQLLYDSKTNTQPIEICEDVGYNYIGISVKSESHEYVCSMASPLNNRCFYGANTTNEWVVREYIKDKENNPTIYNGLPLHTEYRVFVDFDTKEILGASPYWRSDVMKNEFKKVSSPQERHDYVVYKMHEDILNQRYHESVQTVLAELKKVIPRIELTGQWSVDVMRNGNDYYIIDMALAENSALNDCVPSNRLRAYPQQWLPGESNS